MTTVLSPVSGDPVALPRLEDDLLNFYKENGYVLLKGLLTPNEAQALQSEVMDIMNIIGLQVTKLRQSHEYLTNSHLDRFVNSPHLLQIAETLMEGPSTMYLPFTAVKTGTGQNGTGGGQFHFHQDNQYTRFDGPGINLWFALSPMTEQNGCLKVVPRSHLHGTRPSFSPDNDGHKSVTFEPEEFVSVVMEPGDCVAFSRLTVHGSGPNATPDHRVAYAVQFHRNDINYSLDGGQTYVKAINNPRWSTGPVTQITPPKGKLDGH